MDESREANGKQSDDIQLIQYSSRKDSDGAISYSNVQSGSTTSVKGVGCRSSANQRGDCCRNTAVAITLVLLIGAVAALAVIVYRLHLQVQILENQLKITLNGDILGLGAKSEFLSKQRSLQNNETDIFYHISNSEKRLDALEQNISITTAELDFVRESVSDTNTQKIHSDIKLKRGIDELNRQMQANQELELQLNQTSIKNCDAISILNQKLDSLTNSLIIYQRNVNQSFENVSRSIQSATEETEEVKENVQSLATNTVSVLSSNVSNLNSFLLVLNASFHDSAETSYIQAQIYWNAVSLLENQTAELIPQIQSHFDAASDLNQTVQVLHAKLLQLNQSSNTQLDRIWTNSKTLMTHQNDIQELKLQINSLNGKDEVFNRSYDDVRSTIDQTEVLLTELNRTVHWHIHEAMSFRYSTADAIRNISHIRHDVTVLTEKVYLTQETVAIVNTSIAIQSSVLTGNVSNIKEAVENLTERSSLVEERVETVDLKVSELNNTMARKTSSMKDKFQNLTEKISHLEDRAVAIDEVASKQNSSLMFIYSSLTSVEGEVNLTKHKIDSLSTSLLNLTERVRLGEETFVGFAKEISLNCSLRWVSVNQDMLLLVSKFNRTEDQFNSLSRNFTSLAVEGQSRLNDLKQVNRSLDRMQAQLSDQRAQLSDQRAQSKYFEFASNKSLNKLKEVKNETLSLKQEVERVRLKANYVESTVQNYSRRLTVLNSSQTSTSTFVNEISKQVQISLNASANLAMLLGTTYIHWGARTCGNNSETVYTGFGVTSQNRQGGSVEFLCLTNQSIYRKYDQKEDARAHSWLISANIYDPYDIFDDDVTGHTIQCQVCRSPRTSQITIYGSTECPSTWTKEYDGYLMSSNYNRNKATTICVAANPAYINGTRSASLELFFVSGRCRIDPTLPKSLCPPYVNARELTCAICTK